MNLKFKYLLIYLGIPFFIGLFFINALKIDKKNGGGPTTTLSHTNDIMNSTVSCATHLPEPRSIGVQSTVFWEAIVTTESSWLRLLDPVSGENDGFVRYQADLNLTENTRVGIITIDGQEFAVIQSPYDPNATCSVGVEETEYRVSNGFETVELHINDGGLNQHWQIYIGNAEWLQSDRTDGRGSGSANLFIDRNPGFSSRMSVVVVGDKTIPIIQGGLSRDR